MEKKVRNSVWDKITRTLLCFFLSFSFFQERQARLQEMVEKKEARHSQVLAQKEEIEREKKEKRRIQKVTFFNLIFSYFFKGLVYSKKYFMIFFLILSISRKDKRRTGKPSQLQPAIEKKREKDRHRQNCTADGSIFLIRQIGLTIQN